VIETLMDIAENYIKCCVVRVKVQYTSKFPPSIMATKLSYWDSRGTVQPIRLLLRYVGEKYVEDNKQEGPDPVKSYAKWYEEKVTLDMPFPNLPYYIDGDLKLSQSMAILRHVARKYNLDGDTLEEKARVDVVSEEILDIKRPLLMICFAQNFDELRPKYLETLPKKLKAISSYLGSKTYIVGEKLTYADFLLYEQLYLSLQFEPNCLNDLSNLREYKERFEAIPQIKAYIESDEYIVDKFGCQAVWGYEGDTPGKGFTLSQIVLT